MIIPSVMFIEMAMDSLKSRDAATIVYESTEFNCLGSMRMAQILQYLGINKDSITDKDVCPEMRAGYLLGLETARMLLSTMPKAVQNDVSI